MPSERSVQFVRYDPAMQDLHVIASVLWLGVSVLQQNCGKRAYL
jgi:hypothetical protein